VVAFFFPTDRERVPGELSV